jgi:hypothetical protein
MYFYTYLTVDISLMALLAAASMKRAFLILSAEPSWDTKAEGCTGMTLKLILVLKGMTLALAGMTLVLILALTGITLVRTGMTLAPALALTRITLALTGMTLALAGMTLALTLVLTGMMFSLRPSGTKTLAFLDTFKLAIAFSVFNPNLIPNLLDGFKVVIADDMGLTGPDPGITEVVLDDDDDDNDDYLKKITTRV